MPPGVDHAFFAPGLPASGPAGRSGSRVEGPLLAFVGRIQPLKGADIAVRVLEALSPSHRTRDLVVVGGPSGPHGEEHLAELHRYVAVERGLTERGPLRRIRNPTSCSRPTTGRPTSASCRAGPSPSGSSLSSRLRAERPVVAAAVGGLTTLVDDGWTGFLVEGHEVEAFARAAAKVLDDPSQAASHVRPTP